MAMNPGETQHLAQHSFEVQWYESADYICVSLWRGRRYFWLAEAGRRAGPIALTFPERESTRKRSCVR